MDERADSGTEIHYAKLIVTVARPVDGIRPFAERIGRAAEDVVVGEDRVGQTRLGTAELGVQLNEPEVFVPQFLSPGDALEFRNMIGSGMQWKGAAVGQVKVQREALLAKIAFAAGGQGALLGLREGRKEEAGENGNNGDDDKELNEGEGVIKLEPGVALLHGISFTVLRTTEQRKRDGRLLMSPPLNHRQRQDENRLQ